MTVLRKYTQKEITAFKNQTIENKVAGLPREESKKFLNTLSEKDRDNFFIYSGHELGKLYEKYQKRTGYSSCLH